MIDVRPRIIVRLLLTRGRIRGRFDVGRLRKKGMVRNSTAPTMRAAPGGVIREHIRTEIGTWDPSGERGRADLDALIRRAERH